MRYRYNVIFNIPERNLSQQKLTKAFFLRNFDLSSAEKKILNNAIVQMDVLVQILPEQSNIPAFVNDTDSYEQLLIVICTVQDNQLGAADKCILLLQKYISHQILLVVEDDHEFIINASEKRINQNDRTKLTIERSFTTGTLSKLYKNDLASAFFKALDFVDLDKTNLALLYKSYIQAIVQYQVATTTGSYAKRTIKHTEEDMRSLESIENLERDISALTSQIKKEGQLNQRIQLNIKIHETRRQIEALKQLLIY